MGCLVWVRDTLLSPLDGVFGLGERHQTSVVAGRGAALEVDPVPDTAPVQLLIPQNTVPVADPLGTHLVQSLEHAACH